jgi:hypothetical protein
MSLDMSVHQGFVNVSCFYLLVKLRIDICVCLCKWRRLNLVHPLKVTKKRDTIRFCACVSDNDVGGKYCSSLALMLSDSTKSLVWLDSSQRLWLYSYFEEGWRTLLLLWGRD